jgi:hypothetical protein
LRPNPADAFKAKGAPVFYCHLAEASGFYEVPKNMPRGAGGERCNARPFQELVEMHKHTGAVIAPNANQVLRDLVAQRRNLASPNWRLFFVTRLTMTFGTITPVPIALCEGRHPTAQAEWRSTPQNFVA